MGPDWAWQTQLYDTGPVLYCIIYLEGSETAGNILYQILRKT